MIESVISACDRECDGDCDREVLVPQAEGGPKSRHRGPVSLQREEEEGERE